jgi:hypothetical protein
MHKYERSKADRPDGFVLNKLEEAHEEFMETH